MYLSAMFHISRKVFAHFFVRPSPAINGKIINCLFVLCVIINDLRVFGIGTHKPIEEIVLSVFFLLIK